MRTQRSGYIINISSTAGLIGVYSDRFKRALQRMEEDERNGSKPGKVAVLVDYIINHPIPTPTIYAWSHTATNCSASKKIHTFAVI